MTTGWMNQESVGKECARAIMCGEGTILLNHFDVCQVKALQPARRFRRSCNLQIEPKSWKASLETIGSRWPSAEHVAATRGSLAPSPLHVSRPPQWCSSRAPMGGDGFMARLTLEERYRQVRAPTRIAPELGWKS